MPRYDERADLAPRDVVARSIDFELKRSGDDCVFLDCTALDPAFVRARFPNIHERCLQYGFDMTKQPIPVVPAAHYGCGGVRTDLRGETDIENLFAAGEVASTGLHGANRLASNSLLEGVVFARAAAAAAIERLRDGAPLPPEFPAWNPGPRGRSDRGGARERELGRDPPADVELRRHRAQQQAARSRAPAHRQPAARDPRLLLELRAHAADWSSCATWRSSRS